MKKQKKQKELSLKKNAEEQIAFQANILSHVRDSVIVTDLEGKITYWNQGAKEMYGYTASEMIGKTPAILYPELNQTQLQEDFEKIREGKPYIGEWKGRRKDGSQVWIEAYSSVFTGEEKKVMGFICISRDITEKQLTKAFLTEKKQTEESLQYKAEASKILSSSLDYLTTFASITKLAVPHIADWCVVDILDDQGVLQQLAVAHIDPQKVKWAKEWRKRQPIDIHAPTGVAQVLRTGKAEYYPNITEELIIASAKNEEELALIRKIGFSSVIIAPITVDKRTIGAITFIYAQSKRHYTPLDLQVTEQLASRAGMAIQNAKLYSEAKKDRERLHNLLANVPGIVWEAWGKPNVKTYKINFVSKHVEKMLGYTVKEWLHTPNFWLTVVHPEDKEHAAQEAAAIFESGKLGSSRSRWIKRNKEVIWVESQSHVIKDRKGNPIGMRGVSMDISERMELEKRKDEFISMASHELKTPITSVKVFIQVLQKMIEKKGEKQMQKYLNRMDQQMNKLTALVSDLLDVSKIQAGKLELRKEPFSLQKLIRETVENIQATTQNHEIVVKGVVRKKVHADKERIGQVLINLLSNAIKYSPESKKVILSVEPNSHTVILSVKDYGVGIDKEHQVKIFDRFYRVYDTTDKTFPGLGMGLYISSQIVKRHSGSMWVKSKKGKGATFYFALPFSI